MIEVRDRRRLPLQLDRELIGRVSPNAGWTYACLAACAGRADDQLTTTLAHLQELTRLGRRAVIDAIQELETAGWVVRHRRSGKPSVYELHIGFDNGGLRDPTPTTGGTGPETTRVKSSTGAESDTGSHVCGTCEPVQNLTRVPGASPYIGNTSYSSSSCIDTTVVDRGGERAVDDDDEGEDWDLSFLDARSDVYRGTVLEMLERFPDAGGMPMLWRVQLGQKAAGCPLSDLGRFHVELVRRLGDRRMAWAHLVAGIVVTAQSARQPGLPYLRSVMRSWVPRRPPRRAAPPAAEAEDAPRIASTQTVREALGSVPHLRTPKPGAGFSRPGGGHL